MTTQIQAFEAIELTDEQLLQVVGGCKKKAAKAKAAKAKNANAKNGGCKKTA